MHQIKWCRVALVLSICVVAVSIMYIRLQQKYDEQQRGYKQLDVHRDLRQSRLYLRILNAHHNGTMQNDVVGNLELLARFHYRSVVLSDTSFIPVEEQEQLHQLYRDIHEYVRKYPESRMAWAFAISDPIIQDYERKNGLSGDTAGQ